MLLPLGADMVPGPGADDGRLLLLLLLLLLLWTIASANKMTRRARAHGAKAHGGGRHHT
jgi:hypothetical protein